MRGTGERRCWLGNDELGTGSPGRVDFNNDRLVVPWMDLQARCQMAAGEGITCSMTQCRGGMGRFLHCDRLWWFSTHTYDPLV